MTPKKIFSFFLISLTIYPFSKCIFSVPDLTKTSTKIASYTIDFKGIDTPRGTYWSLANYHLDMTDFKKTHSDVTGGGAYGGLQTLSNGEKVSIMSFWKINYQENGENKTLKFNRIYPPGEEWNFSGEGEGTSYRGSYNWDSNVWYRFVLHTWEDTETKTTLIGQWIQDLSTEEWTLFGYFNSNLPNSYIGGESGALSLFQEIFDNNYLKKDRSFQFKNMYAFDKTKKQWASIDTSYLYFNKNPNIIKQVGATLLYFYGFSGPRIEGLDEDEENLKNKFTATISQPKAPEFTKPYYKSFSINLTSQLLEVNWEIDSRSCACYQYSCLVKQVNDDGSSKVIYNKKITRPEVTKFSISSNFKGAYLITVTATAISNEFVTREVKKKI